MEANSHRSDTTPNFLAFAIHEQMSVDRVRDMLKRGNIANRKTLRTPLPVKKRHKSLRLIWFLICSIELFVHGYSTTMNYMDYKTATEVRVYMSTGFHPPALTLCMMINEALSISKIDIADRESFEKLDCKSWLYDSCLDVLSKYSLERLMNNLTYDIRNDNASDYAQLVYYKRMLKCMKYVRINNNSFWNIGDVDSTISAHDTTIALALPKYYNSVDISGLKLSIFIHEAKTLSHIREGNHV